MEGNIENYRENNFQVESRESWREVLDHLYDDMSHLYERQSLLIRQEVREKIDEAKGAVVTMAIGGSLLFVGIFAAVATAIIALDYVMPLWASALIVTLVLLCVGGIMYSGAKKKLSGRNLVPTHSLETMGEIKSTLKERVNEYKSTRKHEIH